MKRTRLAIPPDPKTFGADVTAWQQAAYLWMQSVKARLETDNASIVQPVAPFCLGTYTAVSTLVGTDATSNFLATLVKALTDKGLISPISQRIGS